MVKPKFSGDDDGRQYHLMPREKLLALGPEKLSDAELIAILLRTGTRNKSVTVLASEVIQSIGGIQNLITIQYGELSNIKGMKKAKCSTLIALHELLRRIVKPVPGEKIQLSSCQHTVRWLNLEIGFEEQERFLVLFLSTQNRLIRYLNLFKGTVDQSLVHPRDVFREAVRCNASRIVLVHNHPGGSLAASEADIEMTQVLINSGYMIGIEVLDHIIVTSTESVSLRKLQPLLFGE
ncbi:JAB domain-containing protein [Erysipelothrix piscisicarius]|uniref:JAB domain-containing protein n=1 Tax=Erysipelothrix piscisicarius TaxID=2485784 RepID=A0A3Q8S2S3_9FIRM|nr:DNA repair protein RadC [Erysipelothrix piscisicarius]AZK44200.1 JAB domain-containing protein [Erysipelothrix piscisicarius]